MRNNKILLQDLICLVIVSSIFFKLNVIGFINLALVMIFYSKRSSARIRFIMNVTSFIFISSLLIIWSNINHMMNPMDYPEMFVREKLHDNGLYSGYWKFHIPWYNSFERLTSEKDQLFTIKWLNWLALYVFEDQLKMYVS